MSAQTASIFRSSFSEDIFNFKYKHDGAETWDQLAETLVADVCVPYMNLGDMTQLAQYIADMKFIPGGRYLYTLVATKSSSTTATC